MNIEDKGIVYQALCNLAATTSNEETMREALRLAKELEREIE